MDTLILPPYSATELLMTSTRENRMSTTLIVRIQDVVTHTSVPGPPPGPDGIRIFPHLPGPDIPSHKAFDLKLEWRPYCAGADPWQTDEEGMLPVKSGSWSVVDPTSDDDNFQSHISIADGAVEFMILTLTLADPNPYSTARIQCQWPSPPMMKGYREEGRRTKAAPGALNSGFRWVCTSVS